MRGPGTAAAHARLASRLVIGIGNADRGDDAAGLEVARRVRAAAPPGVTVRSVDGDPLVLLDALLAAGEQDAEVYLVDAVTSGAAPGTVVRFDAARPLGDRFLHRGTHTFGLAEVVEIGRALGGLPARLTGYGIEGAEFGFGRGLSAAVEPAVRSLASQLLRDLRPVTKAPRSRDLMP